MHISISLNTFEPDYPANKAAARCKETGFERLDLNYWGQMPNIVTKTWNEEEAWIQSLLAAAQAYDIPFSQMHGPVANHGPLSGQPIDLFLEFAVRSLRSAAILNVPWVVFHPVYSQAEQYEASQQTLNNNCELYSKLIPVMESTGVGIAIENMINPVPVRNGAVHRSFGAVPEQLAELIDKLDHPLFGVCWDTGHAHVQGLRQSDGIRILGKRLKSTHIQDNDGLADQHFLPYLGSVDWVDVMQGLRDVGYTGDFTYEIQTWYRKLPNELRDDALRQAAVTAKHLITLA